MFDSALNQEFIHAILIIVRQHKILDLVIEFQIESS